MQQRFIKTLGATSTLSLVIFITCIECFAQNESELSVINFSSSRYVAVLNEEPEWTSGLKTRQQQIDDRERQMVDRGYGDLMRSQQLRKVEREAARSVTKPSDVYTYKIRVQSTGTKTVRNLYWEYQIIETANPQNISSRQFFCQIKIRANDRKNLWAFSLAPPMTRVISAKTVRGSRSFEERAIINRIEYTDDSVWQRDDWNSTNLDLAARVNRKANSNSPVCTGF